jgi:hypothetical protein
MAGSSEHVGENQQARLPGQVAQEFEVQARIGTWAEQWWECPLVCPRRVAGVLQAQDLLLTHQCHHVAVVQSIIDSRRAPSPAPVVVAAFESCILYRRHLASHAPRIASSNTSPRAHSSRAFSPTTSLASLMYPTTLQASSAAATNTSWNDFLPPALSSYLHMTFAPSVTSWFNLLGQFVMTMGVRFVVAPLTHWPSVNP